MSLLHLLDLPGLDDGWDPEADSGPAGDGEQGPMAAGQLTVEELSAEDIPSYTILDATLPKELPQLGGFAASNVLMSGAAAAPTSSRPIARMRNQTVEGMTENLNKTKSELATAVRKLIEFESLLSEAMTQRARFYNAGVEVTKKHERAVETIAKLTKQAMDDATKSVAAIKGRILERDISRQECEAARQKYRELWEQHEKAEAMAQNMAKQHDTLKSEFEKIKFENEIFRGQEMELVQLRTERAAVESEYLRCKEREGELETLRNQCHAQQSELEQLRAERASVAAESAGVMNQLDTQNQKLRADQELIKTEFDLLHAENKKLHANLDQSKSDREQHERERANLKGERAYIDDCLEKMGKQEEFYLSSAKDLKTATDALKNAAKMQEVTQRELDKAIAAERQTNKAASDKAAVDASIIKARMLERDEGVQRCKAAAEHSASLESRNNKMKAALESKIRENDALKKTVKAMESSANMQQASASSADLELKCKTLQSELEKTQASLKQASASSTDLELKCKTLQSELEKTQTSLKQASASSTDLELKYKTLQSELEKTQTSLKQASVSSADLELKHKTLQSELEKTQISLKHSQDEVAELTRKSEEMALDGSKLKDLQVRYADLQVAYEKAEMAKQASASSADLELKCKTLQSELEKTQISLKHSQDEIAELTRKSEEMALDGSKIKDLQVRYADLQVAYEKAGMAKQDLERQLSKEASYNRELKFTLHQKEQSYLRVSNQLKAALESFQLVGSRRAEMEESMVQERAQHELAKEELRQLREQLEQELGVHDQLAARNDDLAKVISGLGDQVQVCEKKGGQRESLAKEYELAEAQIATLEAQVIVLERQIDDLKSTPVEVANSRLGPGQTLASELGLDSFSSAQSHSESERSPTMGRPLEVGGNPLDAESRVGKLSDLSDSTITPGRTGDSLVMGGVHTSMPVVVSGQHNPLRCWSQVYADLWTLLVFWGIASSLACFRKYVFPAADVSAVATDTASPSSVSGGALVAGRRRRSPLPSLAAKVDGNSAVDTDSRVGLPPIWRTLAWFLLHLFLYVLLYVCVTNYSVVRHERTVWQGANEATRIFFREFYQGPSQGPLSRAFGEQNRLEIFQHAVHCWFGVSRAFPG